MNEINEMWRSYKKERQTKKERNQVHSIQLLDEEGIHYTVHNKGLHLIVTGLIGLIDYWPTTGKWIARYGPSGRGVAGLLKETQCK